MARHLVVALDGPAGSGKSTVAQRVAAALGATLLDTGAIYRTLALKALRDGVAWDDEATLGALAARLDVSFALIDGANHVLLEGGDVSKAIRTPELSAGASQVSAHPAVRAALLEMQRDFANRGPVVAEGRDVGTVVFPKAQVKVFLSADSRERARRRVAQLTEGGQSVDQAAILAAIEARDAADSGRAVAPLKRAVDAVDVDTTGLSIDEVVAQVVALCDRMSR